MRFFLLLFSFTFICLAQSSRTRHVIAGSSLPVTCLVTTGDVFVLTTVTPGLYICTGTNQWSAVTGTTPQSFSGTGSTATLNHNLGTTNVFVACYDSSNRLLDGAIAITNSGTVTVTFSNSISYRCVVNGGIGPPGPAGSNASKYQFGLNSATSYTITGVTHGIASKDLAVTCLDGSGSNNRFEPATVTVNQSTFDVVMTFLAAKSGGYCFIQ